MLFYPALLCATAAIGLVECFPPSEDYNNTIALDDAGNFVLYFSFSGVQANDNITMELHVQTLGWIGLGFSYQGSMTQADMIIGGVKNGKGYLWDRHGPDYGNAFPPMDTRQDYTLEMAKQNNTHTVLKFYRKLITCDAQDYPITNDTVRVLFAWSNVSATSVSDIQPHTDLQRGVKSVDFLTRVSQAIKVPPNARIVDIRFSNVSIPAEETYYHCRIVPLPMEMGQMDLVYYEALFSPPQHQKYLHHILLYQCIVDITMMQNVEDRCFSTDGTTSPLQMIMPLCQINWVLGWAVGASPFRMPEFAAIPMFIPNSGGFVVLEVHFNNPGLDEGIVDSSGMRMYLVPPSRPIHIGTILIGMNISPQSMLIPPEQKEFVLSAWCPATCTSNIPADGLTMTSVFFHAHTAARKMRLRKFHDGIEKPPPMQDMHYDFDYQESRTFYGVEKIMQGDVLLLDCIFDTTNRTNVTTSGYETTQEMCFAFIQYYPRTNALCGCFSGPTMDSYAKAMKATSDPSSGHYYNAQTKGPKVSVDVYAQTQYDWKKGLLAQGNGTLTGYAATGAAFQAAINSGQWWSICYGLNDTKPYLMKNDTTDLTTMILGLKNTLKMVMGVSVDDSMISMFMKMVKPVLNAVVTLDLATKLFVPDKIWVDPGQCPASRAPPLNLAVTVLLTALCFSLICCRFVT